MVHDDLARHRARAKYTPEKSFGCCRVASVAGYRTRCRARRRLATARKVHCSVCRTSRRDARYCPVCAVQPWRDSRTLRQIYRTSGARSHNSPRCRARTGTLQCRAISLKPEVPPNNAADDRGGKPMTVIQRFGILHQTILRVRPNSVTKPARIMSQNGN
jgi:hypothetical protein